MSSYGGVDLGAVFVGAKQSLVDEGRMGHIQNVFKGRVHGGLNTVFKVQRVIAFSLKKLERFWPGLRGRVGHRVDPDIAIRFGHRECRNSPGIDLRVSAKPWYIDTLTGPVIGPAMVATLNPLFTHRSA